MNLAVLILNPLAAAVLLVAAGAKVAVPGPLLRALREVAPSGVPRAGVRVFAVVEGVVAFALLLPATRTVAAAGLAALAAAFVAAGTVGRLRRSSVPCGCLGGGTHPLGMRNVAVGTGLLVLAGLNLAVSDPGRYDAAPLTAAAATILLCLYTHRMLMWRLLRPRPGAMGSV